jgi:tRNA pseudouridine38-40 synthase
LPQADFSRQKDSPPTGNANLEEETRGAIEKSLVQIEVESDGFLYNMVRIIAGTLADVGQGKRPESWVAEVLAARDRRAAGMTAPPQGLFLVQVTY